MNEASSTDTPYGRYITSDGWFVLNLGEALAVRNEQKGGAKYPIEAWEHPFANLGIHVAVLWPGDPNALYHSEGVQEGFLVLSGECTLIVEKKNESCGNGTTFTARRGPGTCLSAPDWDLHDPHGGCAT